MLIDLNSDMGKSFGAWTMGDDARMLEQQAITTVSGRTLPSRIDSICVHGDTPGAVAMAAALRTRLEEQGFTIAPMQAVLAAGD